MVRFLDQGKSGRGSLEISLWMSMQGLLISDEAKEKSEVYWKENFAYMEGRFS